MPYRAKINGRVVQYKNRFAYEVIKDYVEVNKLENTEFFKSHFNGKGFSGYPVVIDETEKQNFIDRYDEREFSNRYFDEPILNQENQEMFITTQWGSDPQGRGRFFDAFILYAKNELNLNIDEEINEINEEYVRVSNMNIKNIILYGAPGVGKTHNYKKLISLIEDGKSQSEIFDSIQKNESFNDEDEKFQTVKDEKRVEFITFHQSFSYEDFIEGFRPQESRNIEIEDGIFKLISKNAKKNLIASSLQRDDKSIDIEELILKFSNYVRDYLDNQKDFFIDKKITIESINDRGAYVLGGSIKSNTQRLTPDILKRDYNDFKMGKINSYEDVRPTFESQRTFHGNARYYFMLYKKINEFEKTLIPNTIKLNKEDEKNFYLVIDEINRGNISKIFGELITLIEESKRGKYEVTLPYSKQKFSVPSNLFIIGTMNTTDKSIALIDVALRRRFTFIKMQPNSELVHAEVKELFEKLNKKITEDIGEDYQIGHSYFMNIEKEDIPFVLKYKIKPLLEEYYYGDDRIDEAIKILGLEKK